MNLTEQRAAKSGIAVTVVIPTRNRPLSLERTLRALARQDRLPDEVIVVDASDAAHSEALCADFPTLPLRYFRSAPAVCAQRNFGIRAAAGSHVLLCDDDIEPPQDYLSRLTDYLDEHPTAGAATGLVAELDETGALRTGFEVPSLRHLSFAFLFQLTVWANVDAARGSRLTAPALTALKRWYRKRGNGWSAAGWPLVTQVDGPVVRTGLYGLGAALVRRDWLLASPFDERLGAHGIGDNYGVALGFPADRGITVLSDLHVLHHRASENRLDAATSLYRRVLALDYFVRSSGRFSRASRFWLAWSLIGKGGLFMVRRQRAMAAATMRALWVVAMGRNPLIQHDGGAAEAQRSVPSAI